MSRRIRDEFSEFLTTTEVSPPPALSRAIRQRVTNDLAPPPLRVFFKTLSVFTGASAATLLVCPQFGVGPLGGGDGLMGWFMLAGHLGCAALCGTWFMGIAATLALLGLRPEERRVLRLRSFGPLGVSGFFSLLGGVFAGILMLIGGDGLPAPDYLAAWAVGAFLGIGLAVWTMRLRIDSESTFRRV